MNIIGADDNKHIIITLKNMIDRIDPGGDHRFYTDPFDVLDDLDKPAEVAFLDIEMPGMDGLMLAKLITERYPLCNIIFLTGFPEYMPSAFDMYASGYILKPFSQKKIEEALEHRRYRTPALTGRPVKVQCFGTFEVFVNNEIVKFTRQKCKDLFAYLVDRKGAACNMDMIIGNIEPDSEPDRIVKNKIRVYAGDLITTFSRMGIDDIVIKSSGGFAVNTQLLDCDYYRYLENDPFALSLFTGEYMTQYEFAYETRAFLLNVYKNR